MLHDANRKIDKSLGMWLDKEAYRQSQTAFMRVQITDNIFYLDATIQDQFPQQKYIYLFIITFISNISHTFIDITYVYQMYINSLYTTLLYYALCITIIIPFVLNNQVVNFSNRFKLFLKWNLNKNYININFFKTLLTQTYMC